MAATEQKLTDVEQKILTARMDEEAFTKANRCYTVFCDKSMQEFNDQKKKENVPFFT